MKIPDLSIIIVSYNTKDMTLACLESVYRQTSEITFEVIVVDNNSSDGSAIAIVQAFPRATVIPESENRGFAGANNLAALKAGGEYLLLLNPDTVILDHAIEKLVFLAKKRPEAGMWGGKTLFPDGSLNPTSCYNHMTPWSLFCRVVGLSILFRGSTIFNPENFGNWNFSGERDVDIITGCFLLIKRDSWERLGGFDLKFFMFGEEVDLCYRAQNIGIKPRFTPEAVIIHYGGASSSNKVYRIPAIIKAKAALIRKHWAPTQAAIGIAMLKCLVLSRLMPFTLLSLFTQAYSDKREGWLNLWKTRDTWSEGYK